MTIDTPPVKQSGFTLVELLISIALGLILTAAVIQTYLSTKRTSNINYGLARTQENARFSLQFLKEEIRNAGYSNCIGKIRNKLNGDPVEFLSQVNSITGWNANNTKITDSFELSGAIETDASMWAGLTAGLPAFLDDQVIAGADVISIIRYEPVDVIINSSDSGAASITTAANHGIDDGSIMLVGDCWQSELFQHFDSAADPSVLTADQTNSTLPGNRALSSTNTWLRDYTSQDRLSRFVNTYYFIGAGASGTPSLFRYQTSLPTTSITQANVATNSQELVEGVESMQVLYGEDTTGDLNPNRYVSADDVNDWPDIVSVRVGLLLRSPSNASDFDQAPEYVLLDDITLEHPSEDLILRYSVNSTVKLRNKGFNLDLASFVCDAATTGCT